MSAFAIAASAGTARSLKSFPCELVVTSTSSIGIRLSGRMATNPSASDGGTTGGTVSVATTSIIPSRQYDAVILGENLDYPPDPYPYFHSSQINGGFNISVYKNLAVDSLLEDARLSIDPAFRADKIKNFSKIVSGDLPAVFICSAPYLYGTNISVKGVPKIRIAENSSDRFLEIGSWYIKSERKSK
ncbi:MAG: hypothetical protein MUO26_14640 [Methanotrichaceae archaeon]|nr:hypothetical protein [Methanotrichaceae archaeon]